MMRTCPRPCNIGLADGALQSACERTKKSLSEHVNTYDLLLGDQPFIHLVHVEEVVARQHPDTVSLGKHFQTDRAFHLLVDPRGFLGVILRCGWLNIAAFQVALRARRRVFRRIFGWWRCGSMLLPAIPCPYPPRETVNEVLGSAISLGSSCCSDPVNQECNESKDGREKKDNDKSDDRSAYELMRR